MLPENLTFQGGKNKKTFYSSDKWSQVEVKAEL